MTSSFTSDIHKCRLAHSIRSQPACKVACLVLNVACCVPSCQGQAREIFNSAADSTTRLEMALPFIKQHVGKLDSNAFSACVSIVRISMHDS